MFDATTAALLVEPLLTFGALLGASFPATASLFVGLLLPFGPLLGASFATATLLVESILLLRALLCAPFRPLSLTRVCPLLGCSAGSTGWFSLALSAFGPAAVFGCLRSRLGLRLSLRRLRPCKSTAENDGGYRA